MLHVRHVRCHKLSITIPAKPISLRSKPTGTPHSHVVSRSVGPHVAICRQLGLQSRVAWSDVLTQERTRYRVTPTQTTKVVGVLLRQNNQVCLNMARRLSRRWVTKRPSATRKPDLLSSRVRQSDSHIQQEPRDACCPRPAGLYQGRDRCRRTGNKRRLGRRNPNGNRPDYEVRGQAQPPAVRSPAAPRRADSLL